MGQNGSENVGDHKLASEHHQNKSETSPTQLKTGRRFSFSDLPPTINAQPAQYVHILPLGTNFPLSPVNSCLLGTDGCAVGCANGAANKRAGFLLAELIGSAETEYALS